MSFTEQLCPSGLSWSCSNTINASFNCKIEPTNRGFYVKINDGKEKEQNRENSPRNTFNTRYHLWPGVYKTMLSVPRELIFTHSS